MTPEERVKDLQDRRILPRKLLTAAGDMDPGPVFAAAIRAAVVEERAEWQSLLKLGMAKAIAEERERCVDEIQGVMSDKVEEGCIKTWNQALREAVAAVRGSNATVSG